MKNFLAPVMQNKVVSTVTTEITKFYVNHESAILTGGTIGFSLATTAVTLKNAEAISDILRDAKASLAMCNTQEEKNQVYALTLKELAPLVTPIIIFQTATIGCAIFAKKQSDKKVAELAGALSIAQAAITQYQTWQKQTEEALGEKKYAKLQSDIYKEQEVDGRRFAQLPAEGAPGEVLMIDKYSGRPFWCTPERIESATKDLNKLIKPSKDGYVENEIATIDDWYGLIGNIDLTSFESELALRFGYVAKAYDQDISAHFADSHYRFPNGTLIPAFEVYLYPEPGCVDWGC